MNLSAGDLGTWIGAVIAGLAMLGSLIGYYQTQLSSVRKEVKKDLESVATQMSAIADKFAAAVGAERERADLRIENLAANESKSRHDLKSELTAACLNLDKDLDALKKEAVSKEEFKNFDKRLSDYISTVVMKVDRLTESFSTIRVIESQMSTVLGDLKDLKARNNDVDSTRRRGTTAGD